MDDILRGLAKVIRPAMLAIAPPLDSGRPPTRAVFEALKKARPAIAKRFGAPVLCRYSGCPEGPAKRYSKGGRAFKVLEYLWDFSFSLYAIPQAIEDPEAKSMGDGKFELLFVAESEMGTKNEICRDLLKLLEARTSIRCLVYRQPRRSRDRQEFEARMIRVLHNHAYFQRRLGLWLFVALMWTHQKIECDLYTLDEQLDRLIPVRAA